MRRYKRLRHSGDFMEEAVLRYVEDNTSLRTVARRMGVSSVTALNWVNQAGRACKDPIETNLE
ncbi:MAG: transposase [Actinomycetota bacterium]|nr:transposase [Actinomycetota bacterium]